MREVETREDGGEESKGASGRRPEENQDVRVERPVEGELAAGGNACDLGLRLDKREERVSRRLMIDE